MSSIDDASFNDLEQSPTQFSWSRHYLTLNISETIRDTDITTKILIGTCANFSRVLFRMILSDLQWVSEWHKTLRGLSVTAELLVKNCHVSISAGKLTLLMLLLLSRSAMLQREEWAAISDCHSVRPSLSLTSLYYVMTDAHMMTRFSPPITQGF